MIGTALMAACLVALVYGALSDVSERRVPNRSNAVAFVLGVATQIAWHGIPGVAPAFLGALVGLAVLFVPFAIGWMGAGDVKILAAGSTLLGPELAILAGLVGLVLGGVVAVAMVAQQSPEKRREVVENVRVSLLARSAPMVSQSSKQAAVPLAAPLAASIFVFAMVGVS